MSKESGVVDSITWQTDEIPCDGEYEGLMVVWDGDAVIPVCFDGAEWREWIIGDEVHVEAWAKIEKPPERT